jgi:prepilin-type N-terminal cleavage/methylation domain-containing protein
MNRRGFTLLEILVAITVAAIVMTILASAMRSQGRSAIFETGTADMQQNVRAALGLFRSELRMAGYGMTEVPPTVLAPIEVPDTADQYEVMLRGNYSNVVSRGSAAAGTSSVVLDPAEAPFPPFTPGERLVIESAILAVAEVRPITGFDAGTGVISLGGNLLVNTYEPGSMAREINEYDYRLDAQNVLWRNNQIVADQMNQLALQYILSDGTVVDNPAGAEANLRAATIDMHAESVEHDGLTPAAALDTEVRIRNLGLIREAS